MKVIKLDLNQLREWVEALLAAHKVYGVQARDDRFVFAGLNRPGDLRLDYDVAVTAPKCFFQPPREVLLNFSSPAGFESVFDGESFILFGVHPYDMAAINQMDKIFASGVYDAHYLERRRRAIIIGCDVQTPSKNVFAGCMNAAVIKHGFDVLLTLVGDRYLAEAMTGAGAKLLELVKGAKPAGAESLRKRDAVWDNNRKTLRQHELKAPLQELPALLEKSYDHPVWEEKAEKCFSCGSCNLVCPTCYCFDVRDETQWDMRHGVRCRVWDGCLLKDFAMVAGGHNFRKSRAERYRHRYYRKGKYVAEKIGEISCVGCGRCISACVTKIANPVEVYNRLLET